jgi:putative ABC transport system permease protein
MTIIQIMGAIELGLIYSLVTIGIYLTFRVINFPDLTVDGSFTLGAAVTSSLIVAGYHPILATLASIPAGMLAGFITGYLHCKGRVLGLLAGILTMIALYSVNLRIMGRPNLTISEDSSIFHYVPHNLPPLLLTIGVIILTALALLLLLRSEFGLSMRATGINAQICKNYGINISTTKIAAIAISNAIVALAGSLFAQINGFADISMGLGTIIIALASIIIGEAIFKSQQILVAIIACSCGAIIYRLIVMVALSGDIAGLKSSDLNIITSLIIVLIMVIPNMFKKERSTCLN